jgi:hypothetical protein
VGCEGLRAAGLAGILLGGIELASFSRLIPRMLFDLSVRLSPERTADVGAPRRP